ncbi:Universal stress protein family protein [Halogranum amylolyticum]|uniref:Universal stress protein family protein n=1 Tax=Halogranum amylolyticum TaxID=660520 RepID=A0A1H8PA61_9EURY|nr:universal stress protein [Halogranum amylolyticum]SEO38624.1 Universal stress protein family protein [Halogranum amylolyticum]
MYHVVLGVDDDEAHARQCARDIVDLPGESTEKRVTIIHSFSDNPSGASATQIASVREASDLFEAADVEYDVEESSGDPAEAIIDVANDVDADLVVVGGRKRSPAGKALFGSVTQTVILNAGRPVMVTGVTKEA